MTNYSLPTRSVASQSMLLRDLTLSPEAPMAFCLRLLLQQLMWTGQSDQLFELIGDDPCSMDLVDARNVLLRLGYSTRVQTIDDWNQLNPQLLPALYLSADSTPYVLSRTAKGELIAGNVLGRYDIFSLPLGGQLVLVQERSSSERVGLLKQLFFRFTNRIVLLYAISLSLALLALALPFYMRSIYNVSIPSQNYLSASWSFLGVSLLFILDWILRQWRASILSELGGRLDALLGARLLEKMFGFSFREIEQQDYKLNFLRTQSSLDNLLEYCQGPLASALLDFPFVGIYLLAIVLIAGPVVLVPILLMACAAILVWFLSKYYSGASQLNNTSGVGMLQNQRELVNRFLEVKLANVEWVWLQRLRGLSAEYTKTQLVLTRQAGRLQVITSSISQLGGILTLGFGIWLATVSNQGPAAMGNLMAAMFFVWRVFTPFQSLMNALLRLDSNRKNYMNVANFMSRRGGIASNYTSSSGLRLRGAIVLDSACYQLMSEPVFPVSKVSLSLSPGELLVITGNPGCGKTTVLRLIDLLYPLTRGTLLFDGKDHRQFPVEVIQKNIAYLMSKPQLLPGTLYQNLVAMNPDATQSQVEQVCDSLGILKIIQKQPQGFNSYCTDELIYRIPSSHLCLIGLAQALIKDTPILLIDDISQGLAPEQFDVVLQALPSFKRSLSGRQDRTVIIATDNKLIWEKADRLCILDKGVTKFCGTPSELRQQTNVNRS